MEEAPIGPNPCSTCGGEYGEHDFDCPQGDQPLMAPDSADVTLRDYFAAAALQGLAASASWEGTPDDAARVSYKWAAAMLKARES